MYVKSPDDRGSPHRYLFGGLGIVAALVLIGVSMSMNYRFGFNLGRTETDGYIYGAASIAADAMKCLAPFFFFAAIRNKVWSQAAAAGLVGIVVTVYALTGAFGHVMLNRIDTASQRTVASDQYKTLKADEARTIKLMEGVPTYRPTGTVEAEIASQKTARMFQLTNGCAPDATQSGGARAFCSNLHKLEAERASSIEGARLQSRLDEITSKLAPIASAPAAGDPQVDTASRVTGYAPELITALMGLLVVALIEFGSTFGLYVAMAYFPDRPKGKRRVETPMPANDDLETTTENTVVQFPRATTAVSASDAAVSASAALGSAVMSAERDGHEYSEDEAKEDLIVLIARDGQVPNQQILADKWGVAKSTVSKWLDRWEEFERVGGAKPYQAKAIVRKGALEAAA